MHRAGRFVNKHVVITGGARGIGFDIAKHFALEGALLSILDFNKDLLNKATEELLQIATGVYPYHTDVSQRQQVKDAIATADKMQPIDILINNAGIAYETPFLNIEEDEWKKILDINLSGMFYVAQSVCRLMVQRKKGVVVNMGSKNGLDGEFGYAHYNASKAGVIILIPGSRLLLKRPGKYLRNVKSVISILLFSWNTFPG